MNFDENGNPTPYGLFPMSKMDFEQDFSSYPDASHRKNLIRQYNLYLVRVSSLNSSIWKQLIGGSFTTQKVHPHDIDLVNIVSEIAFQNVSDDMETHGKTTNSKNVFGIDAYFMPLLSPADPRFMLVKKQYDYWVNWFGHDRKNNPKALIRIDLI